MTPLDLTVVIPTFNERANVIPLLERLRATLAGIEWEAIFVDDDSPDGTAAFIREIGRSDGRVRVLQRIGAPWTRLRLHRRQCCSRQLRSSL